MEGSQCHWFDCACLWAFGQLTGMDNQSHWIGCKLYDLCTRSSSQKPGKYTTVEMSAEYACARRKTPEEHLQLACAFAFASGASESKRQIAQSMFGLSLIPENYRIPERLQALRRFEAARCEWIRKFPNDNVYGRDVFGRRLMPVN